MFLSPRAVELERKILRAIDVVEVPARRFLANERRRNAIAILMFFVAIGVLVFACWNLFPSASTIAAINTDSVKLADSIQLGDSWNSTESHIQDIPGYFAHEAATSDVAEGDGGATVRFFRIRSDRAGVLEVDWVVYACVQNDSIRGVGVRVRDNARWHPDTAPPDRVSTEAINAWQVELDYFPQSPDIAPGQAIR